MNDAAYGFFPANWARWLLSGAVNYLDSVEFPDNEARFEQWAK